MTIIQTEGIISKEKEKEKSEENMWCDELRIVRIFIKLQISNDNESFFQFFFSTLQVFRTVVRLSKYLIKL